MKVRTTRYRDFLVPYADSNREMMVPRRCPIYGGGPSSSLTLWALSCALPYARTRSAPHGKFRNHPVLRWLLKEQPVFSIPLSHTHHPAFLLETQCRHRADRVRCTGAGCVSGSKISPSARPRPKHKVLQITHYAISQDGLPQFQVEVPQMWGLTIVVRALATSLKRRQPVKFFTSTPKT